MVLAKSPASSSEVTPGQLLPLGQGRGWRQHCSDVPDPWAVSPSTAAEPVILQNGCRSQLCPTEHCCWGESLCQGAGVTSPTQQGTARAAQTLWTWHQGSLRGQSWCTVAPSSLPVPQRTLTCNTEEQRFPLLPAQHTHCILSVVSP